MSALRRRLRFSNKSLSFTWERFQITLYWAFLFPISNTRVMTIINELYTKMLNPSYRFTKIHFTNQLISRSIPRDACPLQNP